MSEAELVAWGLGSGLAVATALSLLSPERRVSLAICALLWAGFVVNVTVISPIGSAGVLLSAAMDVICGYFVVLLRVHLRAHWLLGIFYAYLTQLLFHTIFYTLKTWLGETPAMLYQYQVGVNILLGVQILCVGWPGARRAGSLVLRLLLPVPSVRRRREAQR